MFVTLGLVINRVLVPSVNSMYGKDFKFFEYLFVNGDLAFTLLRRKLTPNPDCGWRGREYVELTEKA